ncbi:hypothetical protein [Pandoraea sp.]|uniref:hypothetical protein n=1 Tax=Pandoraea sp. TaxID=1883445 RepID=UPI0011FF5AC0|nr:hypothetical protein [Pandoraea sp.]TAL53804.1 MAG: hypothetical protein EPN80_14145 [Pandoraea sp.]TAM17057.1 MAG: hypothetical protein EPN65_12315 [Pandoraea sp.]
MDKMLKLALAIALLLAGGGVFYHYVIFLPAVERQAAAQAEQEKAKVAQEEAARNLQYQTCKTLADQSYLEEWAAACKDVAHQQLVQLRNCLSNKLIMSNSFMGATYCKNTFGASDPSPNCSLPTPRADSINQDYGNAQQKCLEEAKLGLSN